MDKLKQRLKKDKHAKECTKDKNPQFITDVNSFKENLKIKEILRTVKMSSSMRLKTPHGDNVMSNKDFNNDDCLEISAEHNSSEPLCAANPNVLVSKTISTDSVESISDNDSNKELENRSECNIIQDEAKQCINNLESNEKNNLNQNELNILVPNGKSSENSRERKLSLDHTILSRQDGFSQSELDLHSIGKSPLERKSSFFRKKMDSFVRNTTEMFRRQNRSLQRRVSMSVSLQSLNEKYQSPNAEAMKSDQLETYGSRSSLQIPTPIVRSTSSLSLRHSAQPPSPSPQNSLAGSHPTLHALSSSTLENLHSNSDLSLNDFYLKEAMLKSRAISMNSGLDSPFGQQRKTTSRSNRVTWIASEGLTNYLRRKIQDERSKEMQTSHSYQDFSCIPEHERYCQNPDTKGRRLSYQRAVSGEDPVMPVRYQDSTLRRRQPIVENVEAHSELMSYLAEFAQKGVPSLRSFEVAKIPDESMAYLLWATKLKNIEELYDWQTLPAQEQCRQAVIRELIHTEAEYIKHLMAIVEVFIAAAHAIQDRGKMLGIQTSKLFSNLPDLLNSSLYFWNLTFIPMIEDAVRCNRPFDTDLMVYGFSCFKEILLSYEKFFVDQSKLLEYFRTIQNDAEFNIYLAWCHSRKECNRLQLKDFLIKPMQRITKYGLILQRIADHTDSDYERSSVETMETYTKNYVVELNRCVRQREEIEKVINLDNMLIAYEMTLKDEEVEKVFKAYAHLNLLAPMLYCLPTHSRSLIHQADLRFRDGAKEIEVRCFLLTDMLLVCRKLTKGNQCKLIRPKYMIDKLVQIAKFDKHNRDLTGLAYVMVDDVGSSYASFILSEAPKDPNPQLTLKTWENKVKEAKLTYELTVMFARSPNRNITQQDVDLTAESTSTKSRHSTEEGAIEHEARERVATMVQQSMRASYDRNVSLSSLTTDSCDGSHSLYTKNKTIIVGVSARPPIFGKKSNVVHRTSTVSSFGSTPRNSRLSSFQHSTSAQSHDDPQAGPSRLLHRGSTSAEHHLPTVPDANEGSPSITVCDTETVSVQVPTLKPVPIKGADSSERPSSAQNTLRVQTQNNVATLIYSLPDLTIEPSTPHTTNSPTQPTASERMYQSHHEILERNRLMASQNQQYLSPDHRGSSYPPPSPTRGSLRRGFAFSYNAKTPPLTKMGHVTSQSQVQLDATNSKKDEKTSPKSKHGTDKSDKKSKLPSTRKQKKKGEKVKSDASPSRKEESPICREAIYDPYRRQGSSCSSYQDDSPGTSYRDESPRASSRGESTSPSRKDESLEVSYREGSSGLSISKTPSPHQKDNKGKPNQRPDSCGLEKSDTLESNLRDEDEDLTGRRESKSSDSIRKEKSFSFSFKDESYDSSHREESLSFSHRDETPSSDRKKTLSPTTTSKSFEPSKSTKEGSIKILDDSLYSNEPIQRKELVEDFNIKDENHDLSHKTEASSVICKENKGTIDTINKCICFECQSCDQHREQDEESIWLCSEHANSSYKREVTELDPDLRCRFSSSSTSSIQTHEELSSRTSKVTDVDNNSIKYEMFRCSSSSDYAQGEPDERRDTVSSPPLTSTAPESGPSYEHRKEYTSLSSTDEKSF